MNRRTFLQTGLTLAASAFLEHCDGYSTLEQSIEIDHSIITAGNIYFYPGTDMITSQELSTLAERVQSNFNNVGIEFKSISITKDFPQLDRLDLVLLCIGYFPAPLERGYFGGNGINRDNNIKSFFKIPYDEFLISANVGYINITATSSETTRKINLEKMTVVATHELAHGLGARHLFNKECEDEENIFTINFGESCQTDHPSFMITDISTLTKSELKTASFDPTNINAMKKFIRVILSDEKYAYPQNRAHLRKRYLSEPIFI